MPISPQIFRAAFNRFQKIHRRECRFDLVTFRDPKSFAFTEDYKENVARVATGVLDVPRWRLSEIGTGKILGRVIDAIQQKENNLLQWEARNGPKSRAHKKMLEARANPAKRRQLETMLFDLYHRKRTGQIEFESLGNICGHRYELLAYLFFIADRHRFLPIRTKTFDRVLPQLGFSFRTAWQCSWENYQQFLAAMREVQAGLKSEGVTDATVLDAHSFCWILANSSRIGTPPPPLTTRIRYQMFTGSLNSAVQSDSFTPNDDAPHVDMMAVSERRAASGLIAEDIAFQAEKMRLRQEGREDLARRVEIVADRPALGFDIQSLDADEMPRCIEVKNVSGGNRFFLSHGQWQNSRTRPNFWFYLVSGVDESRPLVTFMPAAQLRQQHLRATQFLVAFTP